MPFFHGEWKLGKPTIFSNEDPRAMGPMPSRFGGRMEPIPPAARAASSFGASATAKIAVDDSLVGPIIGKNGVNPKQIHRVTGVKLSIRDHESNSNLRNIELEGSYDQIKQANQMVRDVIANVSSSSGPPARNSAAGFASNKKTKLCENFAKGSCTFGERCHFAHGAEELGKTSM